MRLTTTTAATAAVAGLAALVTGCSSSSSNASGPVVSHNAAKAQPAAAAAPAKPVDPRAALAAAVRKSLAAHTVQFRYRNSVKLVNPTRGENINPFAVGAGIANFDSNLVTMNEVIGRHASQPFAPMVTEVVVGASKYIGVNEQVIASKPWGKASASAGDAADLQITQVMQDVKGPITVVGKSANVTIYQMQVDLHQLIIDQGGTGTDAASFAGTTQTEQVWVNRDGLITRARWLVNPGHSHVGGLDPSEVKVLYVTLDFANYGTDMVVPPHPTA
jgi:hypothetical protein